MAGRLEEHRRVLGVKERALHPAQLQRGRFLPLLPPVHVVLEDAEPPLEPPHPPLRLVDGLADLAQHLRAAAPLCRTSAASRCPRRRRDRHRLPSRRLEEPAPPALQRGPEVAARLRSLRAGRRRRLLLAAVPPALRLLEPSSLELGEKEAEMREVDAAVASSSDGRRGCLRSRRAAGAGAARQPRAHADVADRVVWSNLRLAALRVDHRGARAEVAQRVDRAELRGSVGRVQLCGGEGELRRMHPQEEGQVRDPVAERDRGEGGEDGRELVDALHKRWTPERRRWEQLSDVRRDLGRVGRQGGAARGEVPIVRPQVPQVRSQVANGRHEGCTMLGDAVDVALEVRQLVEQRAEVRQQRG
mmetsp:Transcript_45325/g.145854  ORF Transcript_45325/g.145854 Transcript_45325/m.145854 type:complete len:360 (-) Transcript_45325:296-1375(-)